MAGSYAPVFYLETYERMYNMENKQNYLAEERLSKLMRQYSLPF